MDPRAHLQIQLVTIQPQPPRDARPRMKGRDKCDDPHHRWRTGCAQGWDTALLAAHQAHDRDPDVVILVGRDRDCLFVSSQPFCAHAGQTLLGVLRQLCWEGRLLSAHEEDPPQCIQTFLYLSLSVLTGPAAGRLDSRENNTLILN